MPEWIVVADDLTGALDAAAALAKGRAARAVLHPRSPWPQAPVLALDTGARDHDDPHHRAATETAVALALRDPDARVYLKIDSLLRGDVGGTVRGALDAHRHARGSTTALVAPAFPAMGRITRGGRVHVAGATAPGLDLVAALGAGGLRCAVVPRGQTLPPLGEVDAVVVDCETDEDLDRLVSAVDARQVLFVGSAGLAARLPVVARPAATAAPAVAGPALVVVGSASPVALRQVAALEAGGLRHVPLPQPGTMPLLLRQGPVVVTPAGPVDPARAHEVVAALAETVAESLPEAALLVLTGGHTARAVLERIRVPALEVLAELEPGVVLSRAPGLAAPIVTKAGAFGDDEALLRVVQHLTAERKENR